MEVNLKEMLKSMMSARSMTQKEVADRMGKEPQNITSVLRNNNCKLTTLLDFMEAMDEDLNIVTSKGEKFTLKF